MSYLSLVSPRRIFWDAFIVGFFIGVAVGAIATTFYVLYTIPSWR